MNFELFLANRLHFKQEDNKRVSRTAVKIATLGTVVGISVMIIAIAVIVGFKKEIKDKLVGFGSHYQVSAFHTRGSVEQTPLTIDSSLYSMIQNTNGVESCQKVCVTQGIIKTQDDVYGVMLKGVGSDYDWSFFNKCLVEGTVLQVSDSLCNEVLLSKYMASKLNLKLGDKMLMYFVIDKKARARQFIIRGIFNTGFTEFDNQIAICDSRHVKKLLSMTDSQVSQIEIKISDFDKLDDVCYELFGLLGNTFDENETPMLLRSVRELNPQIFSWLEMLDINVAIVLVLMIIVASFTIVSGMLIHILEKTNMIGILYALGADSRSVQKVFLYQSLFFVGKGLVIGNLIGILVCLVQSHFQIIPLDPDTYYVDHVPVLLNPFHVIVLNLVVCVIIVLVMVLPTYVIKRISPAEAIRFE